MGWMERRGLLTACIVWLTSGCGADEDEGSNGEGAAERGSETGGEAGSEAGGTGPGGEAGGSEATGASTQASADETGEESGVDDCADANENAPCASPGEICSNGDDCGSWTYECQDGRWVQIDGSGCGLEPIECRASPVEGDGCGEMWYEECDLDGDCQDLLQCDTFEWVLREVCCAELAPAPGNACDEPWRSCVIEEECGERRYLCRDGVWTLESDCD